ncbi:MAG: DUF4019 domain-containing protein [Sphingomonadales bacterium]|nr:DUF4019 domain-containing protein [Sphingomonadales bacterium]MBD3774895.1 DUF4019 domain-containing protein [Paracoccaceae bacterium]
MTGNDIDTLSDKEKETLRLIVRGHDAKSAARALGLSVHTINERLRVARRKLSVTSSREAARLLLERERETPENLAGKDLGDGDGTTPGDVSTVPEARHPGRQGKGRMIALLVGALAMSILAAALLLSTPLATDGARGPDAETAARDASVEAAARSWLELVGAGNWEASYAGTASAFREANTLELWSNTATRVQGDLGAMQSRQFMGADDVPSPQGFTMVKFRTDYTKRKGVIETLSLVREDGVWKVAGIYVS